MQLHELSPFWSPIVSRQMTVSQCVPCDMINDMTVVYLLTGSDLTLVRNLKIKSSHENQKLGQIVTFYVAFTITRNSIGIRRVTDTYTTINLMHYFQQLELKIFCFFWESTLMSGALYSYENQFFSNNLDFIYVTKRTFIFSILRPTVKILRNSESIPKHHGNVKNRVRSCQFWNKQITKNKTNNTSFFGPNDQWWHECDLTV